MLHEIRCSFKLMNSLRNIIPNHTASFAAVCNFCSGYWVTVTLREHIRCIM
jgi:hypothetical protein